jgi:hypothetical protein
MFSGGLFIKKIFFKRIKLYNLRLVSNANRFTAQVTQLGLYFGTSVNIWALTAGHDDGTGPFQPKFHRASNTVPSNVAKLPRHQLRWPRRPAGNKGQAQ